MRSTFAKSTIPIKWSLFRWIPFSKIGNKDKNNSLSSSVPSNLIYNIIYILVTLFNNVTNLQLIICFSQLFGVFPNLYRYVRRNFLLLERHVIWFITLQCALRHVTINDTTRYIRNVYIFFNPIKHFKMKGEIAICASPSCNKQFVKKSYRQNCCGSSTCRTLYNRQKNGQPLYPTFIANTGFTGKQTTPIPTTTSIPTSVKRGNFMNNVTTSVLSGAVGPTIASAIGATTFTQRAATAAFSGAVMPLLKEFISSGNQIRFSSLDEEMIKLEANKNYWQKQKDKAVNGIMPYKSLGGFQFQ